DRLPVDRPVSAVLGGARLEGREVGARIRLRVALAPDLLAREDLGRIALLLLLVAPRDDRGTAHAHPEHVEDRGRLRQRHLLLEDQLFHECETTAAVFLGPRETDVAGVEQGALPAAEELVLSGARDLGAARRLPLARHVRLEPGADGRPEGFLVWSQ